MPHSFYLASKAQILNFFDTKPSEEEKLPSKKSGIQSLPETDAYLHLLCCIYFIDNKNNEKVHNKVYKYYYIIYIRFKKAVQFYKKSELFFLTCIIRFQVKKIAVILDIDCYETV